MGPKAGHHAGVDFRDERIDTGPVSMPDVEDAGVRPSIRRESARTLIRYANPAEFRIDVATDMKVTAVSHRKCQ